MKQIITIEIDETTSHRYDYAAMIMLALYDKKCSVMNLCINDAKDVNRKVAVEYERLIHAVAKAKIRRVKRKLEE